MKLLIIKYDNGYAVTCTEFVVLSDGKREEHQVKRVFEQREAMMAFIQEKLL